MSLFPPTDAETRRDERRGGQPPTNLVRFFFLLSFSSSSYIYIYYDDERASHHVLSLSFSTHLNLPTLQEVAGAGHQLIMGQVGGRRKKTNEDEDDFNKTVAFH